MADLNQYLFHTTTRWWGFDLPTLVRHLAQAVLSTILLGIFAYKMGIPLWTNAVVFIVLLVGSIAWGLALAPEGDPTPQRRKFAMIWGACGAILIMALAIVL